MRQETKQEIKNVLKSAALALSVLAVSIGILGVCTYHLNAEKARELTENMIVEKGEESGLKISAYAATSTTSKGSYTVQVRSDPSGVIEFLNLSSELKWNDSSVTDDISAYLTAEKGIGNGVYILNCLQPFGKQATFTVKDQYNRTASVTLDYKAAVTDWEEEYFYTGDYNYGEVANLSAITNGFSIKYSVTYGVGTIQPKAKFDESTTAFFQPSFIEEFYATAQDNYDVIDWKSTVAAPTLPENCFYNYGDRIGMSLPSDGEDDGSMSISYFLPGYDDMSTEMKRAATIGFLCALRDTIYDDPQEDIDAPIAIDGWQDFSEFPTRSGEYSPNDTDRVLFGINFDINIFVEFQEIIQTTTIEANVSSIVF